MADIHCHPLGILNPLPPLGRERTFKIFCASLFFYSLATLDSCFAKEILKGKGLTIIRIITIVYVEAKFKPYPTKDFILKWLLAG